MLYALSSMQVASYEWMRSAFTCQRVKLAMSNGASHLPTSLAAARTTHEILSS